MSTLQLLGLEEGTTIANKEHVVTRGTYLSFLLLRHLRLRELKVGKKKKSAWIKVAVLLQWGLSSNCRHNCVLFWFISASMPGDPELFQVCGEKPDHQYLRPLIQGWSSNSQRRRHLLGQCCQRRYWCFWWSALSTLYSLHASWLQGE